MPSYEMFVLFKVMPKEELFNAVKRTGQLLLSEGCILRKLNGLGINRPLPRILGSRGKENREASYFLYTFDAPTYILSTLKSKNSFDIDIIKTSINRVTEPEIPECTLEEELLPAPYRPAVQELIKKMEKKKKVRFPLNTGLYYNPLQ